MITSEFIEKQKARITKKITELKGEIASNSKYQDQGSTDEDKAKEFEDFEGKMAINRNAEKELSNLESALKRIDDGSYGKCKVDGESIEKERLGIYPEAELCASHAKNK